MKLIIESGATKSNWIVLDDQTVCQRIKLQGINATSNPHSLKYISEFKSEFSSEIQTIYFYGAGVSNQSSIDALNKELELHFPDTDIHIMHDILAAARSVSHNQESIVSILGTGTNTVLFDGKQITFGLLALGHLFSDFGSGFHIGKEVILRYFRNEFSAADKLIFENKYLIKNPNIRYDIYQVDKPNKVIAQYSKYLNDCSQELRDKILDNVFGIFFNRQILSIPDYKQYPLTFVGSIAYAFSDKLNELAGKAGIEIINIVADPIEGVIQYHRMENNE